jgi:uncharacterized protein YebE (UPF0316 family)
MSVKFKEWVSLNTPNWLDLPPDTQHIGDTGFVSIFLQNSGSDGESPALVLLSPSQYKEHIHERLLRLLAECNQILTGNKSIFCGFQVSGIMAIFESENVIFLAGYAYLALWVGLNFSANGS